MNLFGLSPGELLLIGLVAMIVLGPEKLPEVAASVGKWIREFRRATEELTSQFADENPFTEIQKALSLDELMTPTVISTVPDVPAPTPVAAPAIEAPAVIAAPVVPQPSVPEKVKSYHFYGTPSHPGLDPDWIVGAPIRDSAAPVVLASSSADDEWLHGVPVILEPTTPASDEIVLNPILATTSEVDATDLATVPGETNGYDHATPLEELTVEATASAAVGEDGLANETTVSESVVDSAADLTETAATESDASATPDVPAEPSEQERADATLILDPAPVVRREETRQEPAIVGGDGKGRSNEEHQP